MNLIFQQHHCFIVPEKLIDCLSEWQLTGDHKLSHCQSRNKSTVLVFSHEQTEGNFPRSKSNFKVINNYSAAICGYY